MLIKERINYDHVGVRAVVREDDVCGIIKRLSKARHSVGYSEERFTYGKVYCHFMESRYPHSYYGISLMNVVTPRILPTICVQERAEVLL